MRTFIVEFRRILARPLLRGFALVSVAGILVGAFVIFVRSHPPDPSSFQMSRFFTDPRFYLNDLPDILKGLSPFAMVMTWLLGASSIGAEWNSGAIATTLTWEPRRTLLFVAKGFAAGVVLAAGVLCLEILLGIALTPAAAFRGSTAGLTSEWWSETIGVATRIALLGGITAVMGFSIASIGRNTAAALGAGFVYLAVLENLLRAWKTEWAPWLVGDNAVVLVEGQRGSFELAGRSPIEAALVLACYSGLLFAVGLGLFRRRDVT